MPINSRYDLMLPLVTVIGICYNHERFLKEALDSVLNQIYPNLEIILVDDFSTDYSREILADYAQRYPQITYLPNERNLGVCASFNRGFAASKGAYLVDFATDDVLLPERIAEQVAIFEKLEKSYGVIYTDAQLIDDNGAFLGNYYKRDSRGKPLQTLPTGNAFAAVLKRHFISPPTLLVRREVLEKLNGYDESLAYEDFDFWVRSSREFRYYFLDKPLTKRRLHQAQLSQQQYKSHDKQIFSTIKVCRKALDLIRTEEEKEALITRVELELKQAIFTQNREASDQLFKLLQELNGVSFKFKLLKMLSGLPLPLAIMRQLYYQWKYQK